jgi:hypothetical protein
LKQTYKAKKYYASYKEVAEDPNVDAIYIATPNRFQFENVKLCLQAEKAVLCEKPITINSIQAKELFELSQSKNTFLMEALWTRFLPIFGQVRQWMEAGNEFELKVLGLFKKMDIILNQGIAIPIGLNRKKDHKFDLGSINQKIIVECKSHKWTETGKTPSAKISNWDQTMFYFLLAPENYRKIFVVLKSEHSKRNETLAEYYMRLKAHLIPDDVEIWELDDTNGELKRIDETL